MVYITTSDLVMLKSSLTVIDGNVIVSWMFSNSTYSNKLFKQW